MKKLIWFIVFLALVFFGYRYYQNLPLQKINKEPSNVVSKNEIQTETIYTYQLFFNNTIKDPNLLDCTHVYAIERKTKETITPEFVMKELIKGLTQEEIKLGFVTSIPKECQLNFVTVNNEKAIVDFKPFQIAGSCATGAFSAQVKQTILALANIKEIQITIQGKSEEILQP